MAIESIAREKFNQRTFVLPPPIQKSAGRVNNERVETRYPCKCVYVKYVYKCKYSLF